MHNLTNLDGLIINHKNNIEKLQILIEKVDFTALEDKLENDQRQKNDQEAGS